VAFNFGTADTTGTLMLVSNAWREAGCNESTGSLGSGVGADAAFVLVWIWRAKTTPEM
jgi:hypothetical protein